MPKAELLRTALFLYLAILNRRTRQLQVRVSRQVEVSRPRGIFTSRVRELICVFKLRGERVSLCGQHPESFPGEVADTASCSKCSMCYNPVTLCKNIGVFWFKGRGSNVLTLTAASLRTCTVSLTSPDLVLMFWFWLGQILAEV